jgi:hypothetical protein
VHPEIAAVYNVAGGNLGLAQHSRNSATPTTLSSSRTRQIGSRSLS